MQCFVLGSEKFSPVDKMSFWRQRQKGFCLTLALHESSEMLGFLQPKVLVYPCTNLKGLLGFFSLTLDLPLWFDLVAE